ncbi:hypothetical protein GQX74_013967 [Glossina fuscipes]|nr:hypothetical protein GQX74_013967 [Glossina fuscipes]
MSIGFFDFGFVAIVIAVMLICLSRKTLGVGNIKQSNVRHKPNLFILTCYRISNVKPHCKEFITEFKESKKRNHHTFNCSGLHVRKQITSTTGYENTSAWQQNNQDNSTEQPKEWK